MRSTKSASQEDSEFLAAHKTHLWDNRVQTSHPAALKMLKGLGLRVVGYDLNSPLAIFKIPTGKFDHVARRLKKAISNHEKKLATPKAPSYPLPLSA